MKKKIQIQNVSKWNVYIFGIISIIKMIFHIFYLQTFHTISIILLIISTLILIIGITQQMLSYPNTIFKYEVPFIVVMFVASVSWLTPTNINQFLFTFVDQCAFVQQSHFNWLWFVFFFKFSDSKLHQRSSILHINKTCENYMRKLLA